MTEGDVVENPGRRAGEDGGASGGTVTRADLAEALHVSLGLPRAEAAKYVEMVLDEIFDAIVAREDVKLSSFGAFQVRAKKERLGRNPKTGANAKITARLVVTFKPSNILRSRINVAESGAQGETTPSSKKPR